VPLTGLLKVTAAVPVPLHSVWLDIVLTAGAGFTVTVNVLPEPIQLLADGVTVIVAITGVVPLFAAVKDEIFPVPLAARPIEVVLFVQL
jgi:hypothetical protein